MAATDATERESTGETVAERTRRLTRNAAMSFVLFGAGIAVYFLAMFGVF